VAFLPDQYKILSIDPKCISISHKKTFHSFTKEGANGFFLDFRRREASYFDALNMKAPSLQVCVPFSLGMIDLKVNCSYQHLLRRLRI